jgi:hypothetical protein
VIESARAAATFVHWRSLTRFEAEMGTVRNRGRQIQGTSHRARSWLVWRRAPEVVGEGLEVLHDGREMELGVEIHRSPIYGGAGQLSHVSRNVNVVLFSSET